MNIDDEEAERAAFMTALESGMAHFNEQRFLEAYEIWAERWSEEVTEGAGMLQGLVQLAVAFAKLDGGSPQGAAKLLQTAGEKLAPYAPESYGIDVDALIVIIGEWRAAAAEMVARGSAAGVTLPQPRVGAGKANGDAADHGGDSDDEKNDEDDGLV